MLPEIQILPPTIGNRQQVTDMMMSPKILFQVLNWETNEKLSFIRAMELDFMRETLAKDLIEAQAACGKITNPETG